MISPDLDLLVPAIVAGDAQVFGQFMAATEMPLRRSLKAFAVRVDIEAVVQEAFLRLWQVAPRFASDGRPNGFVRLLCRVARNLALDDLKRRREEPSDAENVEALFEAEPVDPMLRNLIAHCFEELPPKPRLAIVSRIDSHGSEQDSHLAERCAMTLNTFLQNVTRARKLLASCLEAKGVQVSSGST